MTRYLGIGDMGFQDRMKDVGRSLGQWGIPFTGKKTDFFDRDKSMAQDAYQQHAQGSFEFHAQNLEDTGYGVGEIQSYIQRRITESYEDRISKVALSKRNGKWEATVTIQNEFIPTDKIDGMVIS